MTVSPVPDIRRDTSPSRRTLSCLSASEYPKSEFNPALSLSPSRTQDPIPSLVNKAWTPFANVLLPAPDKPVNQTTAPPRTLGGPAKVTIELNSPFKQFTHGVC